MGEGKLVRIHKEVCCVDVTGTQSRFVLLVVVMGELRGGKTSLVY